MVINDSSDFFSKLDKNQRILGLDVGQKTIGLALSDVEYRIATPLTTIKRKKFSKDIIILKERIAEHNINGLVIGLPLYMDGTEGKKCQSVRQFACNILKEFDINIYFQDERFSTVIVTEALDEAELSYKKKAKLVDKMAAAYILQEMLNAR